MRIEALLDAKGAEVVTIPPHATVSEALALLDRHNVGALVVSSDGRAVAGIVSERDVVRHLHRRGAPVLADPVSSIMTSEIRTCSRQAEVDSLAALMTEHRIRHVPVVDGGVLVGIVSIGDVVKSRIGELEADRQALEDFIHAR